MPIGALSETILFSKPIIVQATSAIREWDEVCQNGMKLASLANFLEEKQFALIGHKSLKLDNVEFTKLK